MSTTYDTHLLDTLRERARRYKASGEAHSQMARHARKQAGLWAGEDEALAEAFFQVARTHQQDAGEMLALGNELLLAVAALNAALIAASDYS